MDLDDLRILLQVVEHGSVLLAAKRLRVPRTTVRRRIEVLEAELGYPLLFREAHGVRLTPPGAVFVERGRVLLEQARLVFEEARSTVTGGRGPVRVVEPLGLPPEIRARALLATRDACPEMRFDIRAADDPASQLGPHVDLVLHTTPMPGREDWLTRVLMRTPVRALAAPAYLERRGVPRSVGELAGHETLGWCVIDGCASVWPLLAGGEVRVIPWFVGNDGVLVRTLAAGGGGIALLPDNPGVDDSAWAPLVPVLPELVGCELVMRVSYQNPARLDARVRELLAPVHTILAGLSER